MSRIVLQSSDFVDGTGLHTWEDLHGRSRWQIALDSAFLNVLYDSGNVTTSDKLLHVTPDMFDEDINYYARVQYYDAFGIESEWSDPVLVTVEVLVGAPTVFDPCDLVFPSYEDDISSLIPAHVGEGCGELPTHWNIGDAFNPTLVDCPSDDDDGGIGAGAVSSIPGFEIVPPEIVLTPIVIDGEDMYLWTLPPGATGSYEIQGNRAALPCAPGEDRFLFTMRVVGSSGMWIVNGGNPDNHNGLLVNFGVKLADGSYGVTSYPTLSFFDPAGFEYLGGGCGAFMNVHCEGMVLPNYNPPGGDLNPFWGTPIRIFETTWSIPCGVNFVVWMRVDIVVLPGANDVGPVATGF